MDAEPIRKTLEAALADGGYDHQRRKDIAFHMTDWLDDLASLVAFFEAPRTLDSPQVREVVTRFLVHAPNHLAAASKLMLDIPVTDIFGVGATREDEAG